MRDWGLFEYPTADLVECAILLAREYGFPREVTPAEWVNARFFGLGPHVVFWIEPVPYFEEDFAVHLAVDPEVRGRWPVRRWLEIVRELTLDMGGKRLRAICDPPVADYLERVGWQVGEVGHVWHLE